MTPARPANPHFDEGLVVWSDDLSGRYEPPPGALSDQFDEKWRLVLEDASGEEGFNRGPGVRVDDDAIDDLVYEWTGRHPAGPPDPERGAARRLNADVDPALIEGKRCIDIGCGMGRWTRVMQRLGASEVLSVDAAEHALESVRRFNPNVLEADVTTLVDRHPGLVAGFGFANLWGVAHHTHDPRRAFASSAATVAPGGAIYLMVYSPEGLHATPRVMRYRRVFHELDSAEERIRFARRILARRWDRRLPLAHNAANALRNLLRRPRWGRLIGLIDMMMPWYNWTIPLEVATGWMREAGFRTVTVLNAKSPNRVAHHILGSEKAE